MEPQPDRIEVGSVTSVNPARRELRITPAPGAEHALLELEWIRLAPRDGQEMRCRVASVETVAGGVLVALVPGVLKDTVARLKGAAVVMEPGELKKAPEAERTLLDAVGFAVVGTDGAALGVLKDVYATPAHEILEIEREGASALLVPAVEEVVADIDWERERVVVNDLTPYGVEEDAH